MTLLEKQNPILYIKNPVLAPHFRQNYPTLHATPPTMHYSSCNHDRGVDTVELASSQVFSWHGTCPLLDREVPLIASGDEELAEMGDGQREDKDVVVFSRLSAPSETFDALCQTAMHSCDSDAEDVEEKPAVSPSAYDIISRNEKVVDSETGPLPLAPVFEREASSVA